MTRTRITLPTIAWLCLAIAGCNSSDNSSTSANATGNPGPVRSSSPSAAPAATDAERTGEPAAVAEPPVPVDGALAHSSGCVGWLRNVTLEMSEPEWLESSRIGQVQHLSAKIFKGTDRDTGNLTVPEGCRQVFWESSDPSLATVTADGVVRALRRGNVTITAMDLFGWNKASVDLFIESGVPSDQPVNMYTTWTARRVQNTVIQVGDRIVTARNALLDTWCCKYPAPWQQNGIAKYHWNNDRVGLLSDVVDGVGSLRVVERADEWTVLARDSAVDFQLFRRKILMLDDEGALRLKIREIDDPWSVIASSGIRAFRAHMNWPDEVVTVVREDGLMFTKEINDDDVNQPWIQRDVDGQVDRFSVYDEQIALLRSDGVFGVFDTDTGSWSALVTSGTREFALSALGIFVLLDDGRLRAKTGIHTDWIDLAADVESFKVDGRLVAAQQMDGRFRVKKELNGEWRVLTTEHVLAYALQVDETGEYIGFVPADRVLQVLNDINGVPERTYGAASDRIPEGEIGHITLVADVREPPTRTISIPYPGGSRGAAPPVYGLSGYLRSYPDDQFQCMLDNSVPWTGPQNDADGKTHNCRWVSEAAVNCLFENGPGLPNVVTCYGRFCGGSVPNDDDWDWASAVGSLDSFDQLCLHHDKAKNYYSGHDGLFDACIVAYGIDQGRLTYGGRQIVEGDADWDARWDSMWNIRDVVDNYTDLTSGCGALLMEDFITETNSPRTQDPPG